MGTVLQIPHRKQINRRPLPLRHMEAHLFQSNLPSQLSPQPVGVGCHTGWCPARCHPPAVLRLVLQSIGLYFSVQSL